jgi:hypothetical protein
MPSTVAQAVNPTNTATTSKCFISISYFKINTTGSGQGQQGLLVALSMAMICQRLFQTAHIVYFAKRAVHVENVRERQSRNNKVAK